MNATLDEFKQQQLNSLSLLNRLLAFMQQGEDAGVEMDPKFRRKLEAAINTVGGGKLKVALVGGFSDGKTSIAAAWMERLDKSSMNISHQESSNEVKIYEVDGDIVLIDTPGLFGFKEKEDADTHQIEKYKDITKKYVSEAHLVLYVMDPTNPIKQSHQDDLQWLFRTLGLLPRTVFVLSRFDQIADVEDEADYQANLKIKQQNVAGRLRELIELNDNEQRQLSIVAVAANPFDLGTEHWLSNLEQFKRLSHIAGLQQATAGKIRANGGEMAILEDVRHSVIKDILHKEIPRAAEIDEQIGIELSRLQQVGTRLGEQLNGIGGKIQEARVDLRTFVVDYFADLLLQAKNLELETFSDFFERQIGDGGIVLSTRLQNGFDRHLNAVNLELSGIQVAFDSEISHFNVTMREMGKQGLNHLLRGNLINNSTILATRDGLVGVARLVGVDLAGLLKFKPWGAVNLANGLNGVLIVLGFALEAWDTYEKIQRQKALQKAKEDLADKFNQQRNELVDLINSDDFVARFFPDYGVLCSEAADVAETVQQSSEKRQRFAQWRKTGESIEVEFNERHRNE